MTIVTDHVILRTVEMKDLHEVSRMWHFEKGPISLDASEIAIKKMQANHEKNVKGYLYHLCFAVFEKADPTQIIGWCGLDGLAEKGKTVIFYLIDKDYRNKGYATECALSLIAYAFESMSLESVYGGCDKDNIASAKVLKKAGMQQINESDPLFFINRQMFEQNDGQY